MDGINIGRDSRLSSTSGSFKLDEGFAEDSQQHGDQIQNNFVAWLNTQSDEAKADIAYEILRTLRSTDIAAVVERLNPLLHMDPIEKLPPEITSQIFSYLDATTLLTASLSSVTWRERILDPRLWQDLYKAQGWGIDLDEVKAFEESHTQLVRSEFKQAREELRRSSVHKGQPLYKRRATSDWLQSTPRRVSADVAGWREQHGRIEADLDNIEEGGDEVMTDAPAQSPQRPNKRQSQDSGDEMDTAQDARTLREEPNPSNLILLDEQGRARIDWAYFYKQRQKLELNWLKGRFTNFQLPHPNYPLEAHTECVYTIQFYGKWLVSGSRDKTVRIWDLDTRRLRGKPLVGHSQSVLCLQFDPTPQEDIIISGSSDSSIIVWKFSTGQRLQTINAAHEESVLNLRFDRRYLVTCSKDKKIKVWNRQPLLPTDANYPRARQNQHCRVPSHVIDLQGMDINMLEAGLANGTYRPLKPFSHLMTFEGHNAAVNAIQIHGNKIVSASGDRLIRIWDMTTGGCEKTVSGHQKGIACVQYDGRRIVSGSSDNTVRIYDPASGTEVATLLGHTNLVRTVQAGFGDPPGSEVDDIVSARASERRYQEDLETGKIVEDRQYSRRLRNGDFGSSRVTFGSNLPPGGGGSRWARIVSGSYDESIIIWKKDSEGQWVIGQILKQDEGPQDGVDPTPAESHARVLRMRRVRHNNDNTVATLQQQNNNNQTAVTNTTTMGSGNVMSASQIMQAAMNTSIASVQTSVQNVAGLSRMLAGNTANNTPAVQNALNQITAQIQGVTNQAINQAILNGGHASVNANISAVGSSARNRQQVSEQILQQAQQVRQQAQAQASAQAQAQQSQNQPQQQSQSNVTQQGQQQHGQNQSVSRVFKLQFDARRIVCCSQDSRIVGWDFANGDVEIEECAKFFIGP